MVAKPGGILSVWLSHTLNGGLLPGFAAFLATAIIFFSAFYANYVLATSKMTGRGNLLVALSIILFTSLFPACNQLSAAVIILPLLIFQFQQITKLYGLEKARPVILNIGLIAGTGYLLYHPYAWYLPCCFLGLAGLRAFKITEWLLLLFGMITPMYFILSYEYISDQWQPLRHLPHWPLLHAMGSGNIFWYLAIGIATIWLFIGLAGWQNQMRRMLIQSRKNWYQLLWVGFFTMPPLFIPGGNMSETLALMAFPVGALASNAFEQKERGLLTVILFWTILIVVTAAGWAWANHKFF